MEYFSLSTEEFADNIGISRPTLIGILDGNTNTSRETLEKIYAFSYDSKQGLNLNRTKELLYLDKAGKNKLLFHGAKGEIVGDVDTHHSLPPNDFGNGFYVGESLAQAASWVAKFEKSSIYCFYLKNIESLKIVNFSANREWLLAVLYYRNAFNRYEASDEVKSIIDKIENSDLVIAPIADNEMFATIDSFSRNEITDEACIRAISASNLGIQYVFKSDKACKNLECIERMYLCEKEKQDYIAVKEKLSEEGIQKSHLAIIKYRREGLYFDELFKRKG